MVIPRENIEFNVSKAKGHQTASNLPSANGKPPLKPASNQASTSANDSPVNLARKGISVQVSGQNQQKINSLAQQQLDRCIVLVGTTPDKKTQSKFS